MRSADESLLAQVTILKSTLSRFFKMKLATLAGGRELDSARVQRPFSGATEAQAQGSLRRHDPKAHPSRISGWPLRPSPLRRRQKKGRSGRPTLPSLLAAVRAEKVSAALSSGVRGVGAEGAVGAKVSALWGILSPLIRSQGPPMADVSFTTGPSSSLFWQGGWCSLQAAPHQY